jgi:methylmalonyl-CoA mutase N-terminal domain/subunit
MQALAAVLGGTQSLHTNAYDEALALPTADSAKLALRTQQILANESGVASTADPLAGSYYVETLTARLEEEARSYLGEIEARGGAAGSIPYIVDEIQRAAYAYQLEIEGGDRIVVGVNDYREEEAEPRIEGPAFPELEKRQRERLARLRSERSADDVEGALTGLSRAASGTENLLPHMVEAVKVRATLGEISESLREIWGEYRAAS